MNKIEKVNKEWAGHYQFQLEKNLRLSNKYSMFKNKQKVFHDKFVMPLKLTVTKDSTLQANFVWSKYLWKKNELKAIK